MAKTYSQTPLYLLSIVGIVAIVGVIVLLLNNAGSSSTLVGFATSSATCSDTDGGLAYTTKGTVSGGTWKTTGATYSDWTDRCSRGKLQEGYCSSSTTAFYTTVDCSLVVGSEYVCSAGACIKGTTTTLPDLIITGINSVKINSTNNMTINFTIKNQGTADAVYPTTIQHLASLNYVGMDGSTITFTRGGYNYGNWLGSYYGLKAGESITASVITYVEPDVVADIVAGNSHAITITLTTDYYNSITESDETNNGYTETRTVTSADVS